MIMASFAKPFAMPFAEPIALNSRLSSLPTPAGFDWTPPVRVYKTGVRTFGVGSYDVASFAPTGKAYYVSKAGSDSNDGLTPETPLASLFAATGKPDADIIYIQAGLYARNQGGWPIVLSYDRSIALYAVGGRVQITTYDIDLAFVPDDTLTNTYRVTRSTVVRVADALNVDAAGEPTLLTQQASAQDVNDNPGSWHLDGSNVLWVRAIDDRVPDNDLWVFLGVPNARFRGDITVYAEGIDFIGGANALECRPDDDDKAPRFYAKDCSFQWSYNGNGFAAIGGVESILVDCTAKRNALDGYNYHAYNEIAPLAVEINCVGRDNGVGGDTNNGSSMHDGGSIVRVMGEYFGNGGPNVVDVNGSQAWCLGTIAHSSQAPSPDSQDSNFFIQGEMWLDHCTSHSSHYDLVVAADSTMYTRELVSDGSNAINASGTLTTY